jgi:hypothetical protein
LSIVGGVGLALLCAFDGQSLFDVRAPVTVNAGER